MTNRDGAVHEQCSSTWVRGWFLKTYITISVDLSVYSSQHISARRSWRNILNTYDQHHQLLWHLLLQYSWHKHIQTITLIRWISTSSTVATLIRPGLLLSTASSFILVWKLWGARWRQGRGWPEITFNWYVYVNKTCQARDLVTCSTHNF